MLWPQILNQRRDHAQAAPVTRLDPSRAPADLEKALSAAVAPTESLEKYAGGREPVSPPSPWAPGVPTPRIRSVAGGRGVHPLDLLTVDPSAPERAKASLRELRWDSCVPGRTYERVADALTEWGNPRSAWEVVGWMVQDRGRAPCSQVCHWVFEGLVWGGHLNEAENVVALMLSSQRPVWRAMAHRLARKLRDDGFWEREQGLWRRLAAFAPGPQAGGAMF